ncbi:MAG TPA: helix-turn-helix domain-containing protein [Moraxellaceae bacterium]|nr:helix-turn-helix domain-containing protein [Moraxellaceae bacterium]
MSNPTEETVPPVVPEGQEEHGRDAADYLSFRPGQRLRKAREVRGMTIDQVARELALSPRYVDAMETDSYKDLPEPAFVRGYMRRYAQLVKLSPDDIAAKFDQCYAEDKETPALEVRPSNPIQLLGEIARHPRKTGRLLRWVALAFIIVLLVGFLWRAFATHNGVTVTEEPAATVPGPSTVVPASEPLPVVPAPAAPVVAPSAAATAPIAVPSPAAAPVAAPAATPPAPAAAPVPSVSKPATAVAPAPAMNVLPSPATPPVLPAPGGARSPSAAPAQR